MTNGEARLRELIAKWREEAGISCSDEMLIYSPAEVRQQLKDADELEAALAAPVQADVAAGEPLDELTLQQEAEIDASWPKREEELRDCVEYDRDKLWCDVLFNADAGEFGPKVHTTPEGGKKIMENLLAARPDGGLRQLVAWLRTSDEARKAPAGEIADKLEAALAAEPPALTDLSAKQWDAIRERARDAPKNPLDIPSRPR